MERLVLIQCERKGQCFGLASIWDCAAAIALIPIITSLSIGCGYLSVRELYSAR